MINYITKYTKGLGFWYVSNIKVVTFCTWIHVIIFDKWIIKNDRSFVW
jgi:hypothetical protein